MYSTSTESNVVDLYTVGAKGRDPGRASVPFICGIEVEGPKGENVRVRTLEDGGAMVNAMCTALYAAVRHRIGELQQSGKILRMANGALVPSIGRWEGYIRFGGARVRASFEVFPSGGSWSFLFGKPLLEQFGAVHDYGTDTISVPGEKGSTVVSNQIGRFVLWDKARGSVNTVFLDPKTRAMSTGGSAPPVRHVFSSGADRVPKSSNQHPRQVAAVPQVEGRETGSLQEAQRNSTGALPAPSREVQDVEREENEDDTDEIYFLAREYPDEETGQKKGWERAAHTEMGGGDSEDTRVYLPGDYSRSPRREVPKNTHAASSTKDTDLSSRVRRTTRSARAWRAVGKAIVHGILALAAQYGGADTTSG
jgi:hypothetical protein